MGSQRTDFAGLAVAAGWSRHRPPVGPAPTSWWAPPATTIWSPAPGTTSCAASEATTSCRVGPVTTIDGGTGVDQLVGGTGRDTLINGGVNDGPVGDSLGYTLVNRTSAPPAGLQQRRRVGLGAVGRKSQRRRELHRHHLLLREGPAKQRPEEPGLRPSGPCALRVGVPHRPVGVCAVSAERGGAACRNRTDDLFITSESLWPTELRRRAPWRARGTTIRIRQAFTEPTRTPRRARRTGIRASTSPHPEGASRRSASRPRPCRRRGWSGGSRYGRHRSA